MRVAVSACLLGENCKYSGGNNLCTELVEALAGHEVIPVCPEVLGGLATPRPPAEIVDGVVRTQAGESVDAAFRRGAERALARIEAAGGCDLAVLQPRSPSCGVGEVYDGTFSGTLRPGQGVFAGLLLDSGMRACEPAEALGLLTARTERRRTEKPIDKGVSQMSDSINPVEAFDMKIAHVGINAADAEDARRIAGLFEALFGMEPHETPVSYFSDTLVEIMKGDGRGEKGHIGLQVNDVPAAEEYFASRGLTINEDSRALNPDGTTKLVYFNEQVAGFAIHLCCA